MTNTPCRRTSDALHLASFIDERDNVFAELYLRREQELQRVGWTVATARVTPLTTTALESASAGQGPWLPVAYTVGLTEGVGHPELVLVGLPTDPEVDEEGRLEPALPVMLLRLLAERIVRHGKRFVAGETVQLSDLAEGDGDEGATTPAVERDADLEPSIVVRAVDAANLALWLPQAFLRYESNCLQALQVILPDDTGHLPWEEGCDPAWITEQILLGMPAPAGLATTASVPDSQGEGTREGASGAMQETPTVWDAPALAALAQQTAEHMLGARRRQGLALRASQEITIAKNDWMVQGVFADPYATPPTPPFAYTIGLLPRYVHPELIVTGLPFKVAASLLNDLGRRIRAGQLGGVRLRDGQVINDLANFSIVLRRVDPSRVDVWLGQAVRYAQEHRYVTFEALQLVWPDPHGQFPWDAAYDSAYDARQPRLYEPDPAATAP